MTRYWMIYAKIYEIIQKYYIRGSILCKSEALQKILDWNLFQ